MKLKKAALPLLLVLLLAHAGCAKNEKFAIQGNWSFLAGDEEQFAFTFQGDSEKGTLVQSNGSEGKGTYTVSDGAVVFTFVSYLKGGRSCTFLGTFVAADRIHGNMEIIVPMPDANEVLEVEGKRK